MSAQPIYLTVGQMYSECHEVSSKTLLKSRRYFADKEVIPRGGGLRKSLAHDVRTREVEPCHSSRFLPALEVLSPDFIATRWREDGSYSALLGDLDTMLRWAHDHPGDR